MDIMAMSQITNAFRKMNVKKLEVGIFTKNLVFRLVLIFEIILTLTIEIALLIAPMISLVIKDQVTVLIFAQKASTAMTLITFV